MVLVEAKVVDSTHLELSKPIPAALGQTVLVSVSEASEWDADRQQWLAMSAASRESAYSESEPDYLSSMVKESNPDYRA